MITKLAADAFNAIIDTVSKGLDTRSKNPLPKSMVPVSVLSSIHNNVPHLGRGLGFAGAYMATRNRDLNEMDGGDRSTTPYIAVSTLGALPGIGERIDFMDAYHRGVSAIDKNNVHYNTVLKMGKAPYIGMALRGIVPHIVTNAAGYGVAKIHDKTMKEMLNKKKAKQ